MADVRLVPNGQLGGSRGWGFEVGWLRVGGLRGGGLTYKKEKKTNHSGSDPSGQESMCVCVCVCQ